MNVCAKKIAFFTDGLREGGVERSLSNLSCHFPGELETKIFLMDGEKINYEVSGDVISLGLKPSPYDSLLDAFRNAGLGIWKLYRCKKIHGTQVCISFKEIPNFVNLFSGVSRPIISVREHKSAGIAQKGVLLKCYKLFLKNAYGRAGSIVAISRGIADDLVNNFGIDPAKIHVIHNGFDREGIRQKSLEALSTDEEALFRKPVVMNAGRLCTQKAQWCLIRAFSHLTARFPDCQLVILGTGGELRYLQKIVYSCGLENRVHFLGFKSNPYKYMARARVFALTSLWEGFGNVVVEAMSCGVPVISTDCPTGPREILAPDSDLSKSAQDIEEGRYGILVPVFEKKYHHPGEDLSREEVLLAEGIRRLLEDRAFADNLASRAFERTSDFSMEKHVSAWKEVLERS